MDTVTRVVRGEEDAGSWELALRRPHPALRDHVSVLEGYEEQMRAPVRQHHLPPVFVPVIINFGPPYRLLDPADGRPLARPRAGFVSGLGEAGGMTESDGAARCVQVNLTPLGARSILGVPMCELEDRVVPLEDLLGPEVERLEERLDEAPDWETRLTLAEAFLAARLEDAPEPRPDVVRALRRLEETDGRIRVEALAAELRCSRKHLLAQFREHVGPGPKTVARLLRFNRLLRLVAREQEPDWAGLAGRCGYYDQSHLHREVRRLAGCTPGELARRAPVTFVQDALAASA
jgi:AraC-like DNA-binding protein